MFDIFHSLFFKFEVRSGSVGLFSPSSAETAESSEFLCIENTSLGCSDSPYPLAGSYFECKLLVDCCLDLTLSDNVLVLPRDDYSSFEPSCLLAMRFLLTASTTFLAFCN